MADHYAGEEIMANFWLFFRILLAIFVIYLIFEIIRKILGGSWGVQELIAALLVANLGYSFQINHRISSMDSKLSGHLGWHKGRESHIK